MDCDWDLTDRTLVAFFIKEKAWAKAFAEWLNPRVIFNVQINHIQILSPKEKATLKLVVEDYHEEELAASDLTRYCKEEVPIKYHGAFKNHIRYCNRPDAIITNLLTE